MGVWEWKTVLMLAMICAAVMPASARAASVFFPPELAARARANITKYPWAAEQKKNIVEAAKPWMKLSDDEAWGLMFGPTITRSWMVWSNGYCPSCEQPVPMYNWRIDAMNHPWKAQCPHCQEFFPKNDFKAFYQSGLDEHGIFDPKKADRALLFNAEHPDPKDPLHSFGVDDGEGYVEGDKRWRFIGAYLIYGQWKQAVLGGIRNLATAYVVTNDPKYAHKAAILLDRVADLYPTFDFAKQALCYEVMVPSNNGYVSVWHDACEETRELAMAYDMVRDAIPGDKKLIDFLSKKAGGGKDIEQNIEDRILRDALANEAKIHSNYPRTEIAKIVIMSVLDQPKDEIDAVWDAMLTKASAVDGVTGEKGLAGYTAFTIQSVAGLIEQFSRLDPDFLKDLLKRYPRIHDMYRFHIDTWCMQEYYPQVGDAGGFARKCDSYVGVIFTKDPGGSIWTFAITPSMFSFLRRLYEVTGDTAFVQVLHGANSNSTEGLPYDLFCDDPAAFQKGVKGVIARVGPTIEVPSVNKQDWHIAILRSGEGSNARALWLEYDAWGGHGHANCMEIGLFAKGLDLLPDFGYKPVQFGGWSSPKANWYGMTAAHNTVVVDGRDQGNGGGQTTLWADGKEFRAIRASGPTASGVKEFERTVAMVDISDKDSYILDVFRVVGGKDHAKFTGSHFGTITSQGLTLKPAPDYGNGTQMRNFQVDAKPANPWSVDWKIEDRYKYLAPGSDIHFRYTDLTNDAEAYTAEAWVSVGGYDATDDAWIPRIVTRKSGTEPLASTFVAVMEPYEKQSAISGIRRLALENEDGTPCPDSFAAVEVSLAGGGKDLLISADIPHGAMVQKDWGVRTDAELCLVRLDASGKVKKVAVCKGSFVKVGDKEFRGEGEMSGG
jgi:hypothetical protein